MSDESQRAVYADSTVEVRSDWPTDKGDPPVIEGYAAVFNSLSEDLGGFREIIRPGAFDEALADDALDVSARVQHDGGLTTIGRTTNGTLRLSTDATGLRYEVDPPNTQAGRDIVALIRRGDINKSSFAFSLRDNGELWHWESEPATRELLNLNLYDVAPVDGPAYQRTTAEVRSNGETLKETARRAFDEARERVTPKITKEDIRREILDDMTEPRYRCDHL